MQFQNLSLSISSNVQTSSEIKLIFAFENVLCSNGLENVHINELIDLTTAGTNYLTQDNYLIVSLGVKNKFSLNNYLKALKSAATFITKNKKITSIDLIIEEEIAKLLNFTNNYYVEQTILHFLNFIYIFDELKTNKKEFYLTKLSIVNNHNYSEQINNALNIAKGLFLTKHLANNPGNIATPSYLASKSLELKSNKVSVEVLGQKEIEELNMNCFLAVAKGSEEEPKFIKIHYNNNNDAKPIVLVGKGITFDSGGISLKPGLSMDDMKFDMCGAATVIGILSAISNLDLPINLVGIIPTCENMPSGRACKPGDIIKSMSGKTVEILNTDAEGRLILCDSLTYVGKNYNPEFVIDIATLTGACIIALGSAASGLFCNDEKLAQDLINSGKHTNDKLWQLPLFEEYHEMIKGKTGDIANLGSLKGAAGSATAACFLEEFVDYKWAHLDIAGTSFGESQFNSENYSQATGRPFYLLIDFLRNLGKN